MKPLKIKKWMKWHSFDSFSHLWLDPLLFPFILYHQAWTLQLWGGLQKVHLYRRKWPATANWLEFSAPRFIEVMDLFCCLVCSSTPTLILKHWKIDLSHMTSVTEQNLIVGYQKIFSLFWLWIFVTMTGHRAATVLLQGEPISSRHIKWNLNCL